jgi:hypothetical protein
MTVLLDFQHVTPTSSPSYPFVSDSLRFVPEYAVLERQLLHHRCQPCRIHTPAQAYSSYKLCTAGTSLLKPSVSANCRHYWQVCSLTSWYNIVSTSLDQCHFVFNAQTNFLYHTLGALRCNGDTLVPCRTGELSRTTKVSGISQSFSRPLVFTLFTTCRTIVTKSVH